MINLALSSGRASYNIVDFKFYQVSKNSAKFRDPHYPQVLSKNADIKYGLNYFKKENIMIVGEISNVSPQRVITLPPNNTVFDKNIENEKSGKSEQRDEGTTTKNVIENGKLIVEQYDRHGKLIRKTPPGFLPPGEKA